MFKSKEARAWKMKAEIISRGQKGGDSRCLWVSLLKVKMKALFSSFMKRPTSIGFLYAVLPLAI